MGQVAEERWRTIVSSLGEGLLVLDGDLRVDSINPEGEKILGALADETRGQSIETLAANWSLRDRGPFAVSKLRHHLQRGIPYRNDDAFVVTETGEIVYVSLVMTPLTSAGRDLGAVISFRDVTSLKVAEARLRESEQWFRRTFSAAPIGMIRLAADGSIADSNEAFGGMLGFAPAELLGQPLVQLWELDEALQYAPEIDRLLSGQCTSWNAEPGFRHADGRIVRTAMSMVAVPGVGTHPAFAIGVVEDATERQRLEVELRHAQKLESVGRLAAGIAHEINTPIQFIGNNVQFLRSAFQALATALPVHEDGDPRGGTGDVSFYTEQIPAAIDETLEGIDRVATIVRAMKAFGHPGSGRRALADLNEIVRTTLVVATHEFRDVADVVEDYGTVPPVACWQQDVKQVVLNLLVNAAHAIGDVADGTRGRGTIRVETRALDAGVEVAISDTGVGIPDEMREQVFEPFFTTKEVGRGTGQGLSLAHTVVERHGGSLSFESEVGVGTTFRVWLPEQPAPEEHDPLSPPGPSATSTHAPVHQQGQRPRSEVGT